MADGFLLRILAARVARPPSFVIGNWSLEIPLYLPVSFLAHYGDAALTQLREEDIGGDIGEG